TTDQLTASASSPVYGCCILALSAHQTHLPSGWTGGDRIAIHGGPTAGAVSTGCLHASTADLRYLMHSVPLGARVVIHPSRIPGEVTSTSSASGVTVTRVTTRPSRRD